MTLEFRFTLGSLRSLLTRLTEAAEEFLQGIVRRQSGNAGPLSLRYNRCSARYADVDHGRAVVFDDAGEVGQVLRGG